MDGFDQRRILYFQILKVEHRQMMTHFRVWEGMQLTEAVAVDVEKLKVL